MNWIKTVIIVGLISLAASFATGLFKAKVLYKLLKERE
ncbi:MAG: hypothetical protein BWX59_02469 [Bacteroidetes bacterium ADurb.Bin028]|nr:MAG: hypothetical protein BWX59_02469 [Bacteroidetes bacterium ADurb.Bin028]